jgi:hypothetical protein
MAPLVRDQLGDACPALGNVAGAPTHVAHHERITPDRLQRLEVARRDRAEDETRGDELRDGRFDRPMMPGPGP